MKRKTKIWLFIVTISIWGLIVGYYIGKLFIDK